MGEKAKSGGRVSLSPEREKALLLKSILQLKKNRFPGRGGSCICQVKGVMQAKFQRFRVWRKDFGNGGKKHLTAGRVRNKDLNPGIG